MKGTVLWQQIEGALLFAVGLLILWMFGLTIPIWVAVLVFFAPDLTFAGYLLGPKAGAFAYNLVHTYAFGALIFVAGFFIPNDTVMVIGLLWFAHSGFDRMLGYGLKETSGFKDTHLKQL